MTSVAAQLPAAGIARRVASMLYEALLAIGVLFFGFLMPHAVLGVGANVTAPGSILLLHVIILLAVYFIWFWRRHGQTLAMRTWKIRLQAADGTPPSLSRLLLRFLLAWPSLLCFAIGVIWALFDRDRQFLHDRIAGTRLVLRT